MTGKKICRNLMEQTCKGSDSVQALAGFCGRTYTLHLVSIPSGSLSGANLRPWSTHRTSKLSAWKEHTRELRLSHSCRSIPQDVNRTSEILAGELNRRPSTICGEEQF